ncbi:MAG: hypothetical protein QOG88_1499 [Actinomycetota bacterium]|jgi:hypothetical protein|nr:hypothetical protein [Actinomycetota bacterium]
MRCAWGAPVIRVFLRHDPLVRSQTVLSSHVRIFLLKNERNTGRA